MFEAKQKIAEVYIEAGYIVAVPPDVAKQNNILLGDEYIVYGILVKTNTPNEYSSIITFTGNQWWITPDSELWIIGSLPSNLKDLALLVEEDKRN